MRTLVLYVFHEYNMRVDYFIKNAIFEDSDVDFMIVCNNLNLRFVVPQYVTVLFRKNIGYDFGAWSYGLLHEDTYKSYDNFIFVNSSVMGPYLKGGGRWTDVYLKGLSDDVRLFGSSINTLYHSYKNFLNDLENGVCSTDRLVYPIFNDYAMKGGEHVQQDMLYFSHIQSYIFSMTLETLEYLISRKIFSLKYIVWTYEDAVRNKEVRMSREILDNNWNIGCLMRMYKDVDFRGMDKNPPERVSDYHEDLMYPQHIGSYIFPEELIFIKGNRFINDPHPKITS